MIRECSVTYCQKRILHVNSGCQKKPLHLLFRATSSVDQRNAHLLPLKEMEGTALFTAKVGFQTATTVIPGGRIGMDRRIFDLQIQDVFVAASSNHASTLVTSPVSSHWKFLKRKGSKSLILSAEQFDCLMQKH